MEIWACDENFIKAYLEKRENATEKELEAISLFQMPEDNVQNRILEIKGNVAIITISGVLTKRGPDRWDLMYGYGGTGYGEITEAIEMIETNESIKTIRLIFNTPGGEVAGLDEVGQRITKLSKSKKVEAINVGSLASGGYWLAASASKIYSTSPVNKSGSIGVIIAGTDWSNYDKKNGIKEVRIISKNAENKAPGFDKKGIAILQAQVDATERIFLSRISEGRNLPTDYIIDNFGKGAMLISRDTDPEISDAISVQMIDGLIPPENISEENLDNSIYSIYSINYNDNNENAGMSPGENKGTASAGKSKTEDSMNLDTFLSENPDAKAQYEKRLQEAKDAGFTESTEAKDKIIKKVSIAFDPEKSYPAAIQSLAKKVLDGEEEAAAFTGAITTFDAINEQKKSKAAEDEQESQEETPPETPDVLSKDGTVSNEAEFDAEIKRMKGGTV